MQTIETTQIDNYAQTMLRDRSISAEERARSAAAAMHMHVMTEFGLPIGTPLPLDDDGDERVFWQEDHLERVADSAMQNLMEKSYEAFEWIEDQHPEKGEMIDLTQATLVRLDLVGPGEGFPGSYIELTHEGDSKFYNDDKDEQQ